MEPIIELRNISKKFGGITALNSVSLEVNEGEVVGLIGDNGAGKSTLIKTLVGVHQPDLGEIFIRGRKAEHWNAKKAREAKIETVFQDRALTPQQSIVWNIFMGKELRYPLGFIRVKEQQEEANRIIREIGFTSKLIDANSQ
ncbi:MAG: ATP-binding cassette domain-containing protein, partial [bacterium]